MTATDRIRFYTENVEGAEHEIARILDYFHVQGATVYTGRGLWEGRYENSLIVEVIGSWEHAAMHAIASEIRKSLKQQAVLVTREPIYSTLVEG